MQANQWGWYKWYHARTSGYDNSGDGGGGNRNWCSSATTGCSSCCHQRAGYGWYGRNGYCFGDITSFKARRRLRHGAVRRRHLLEQQQPGYSSYPGQYNGYGPTQSLDSPPRSLAQSHPARKPGCASG